ncbi:MAG: flippase-like domain-containing protein [Methanomassiliicoccales archaeon]|nr:MAG: flippase-like domain-containing protein [Methanomassiliicoccales archaeon]
MQKISFSGKVKIAISVALIILVLLFSDMGSIAEAMADVNWGLILVVVVLYLANLVVKAYRWGVLVQSTGNKMPFRSIFATFTFSQALNNIIPGRVVGETSRIYEVKKREGMGVGTSLATIVTERLMDFMVVTVLAITSLVMLFAYLSEDLADQLLLVVSFLVVLNFFLIYVLIDPAIARKVCDWCVNIVNRLHLGSKGDKLNEMMIGFVTSFSSAVNTKERKNGRYIWYAGALTIGIWTNEIVRTWLIMEALGAEVTVLAVVATCSLASLSGIMLSAGSGNVVVSSAIYTASGLEPEIAATAGVLSAMTSIWLSVPVSIIAILAHDRKARVKKFPEMANK